MINIEDFKGASEDAPVMAKFKVYDSYAEPDVASPYAEVTAAVVEVSEDEGYGQYIRARVLDSKKLADSFFNQPVFGDYLGRSVDLLEGEKTEATQELLDLDQKFRKYHDEAPYYASLRTYGETPFYSDYDKDHEFPKYKVISQREIQFGSDVRSTDDAVKKLIQQYPDEVVGCTIFQKIHSGNMLALEAAGCNHNGTLEEKKQYVRNMADRYGVECGQFRDERSVPDVKPVEQEQHVPEVSA